MNNQKILIIVPAYNEQGNVGSTVKELLSLPLSIKVLVVDDGSIDGTAQEAKRAGAMVISLPFNLGIGGAVQTGFKFALAHDFTIALQVDGDGQHDVTYIEKLIEPILTNDADVVIGSRFLNPYLGYRSSFIRQMGIQFFAHLISYLIHCKITDSTSGFRAFNKRAIEIFAQNYPQDYPEPEAIVLAQRLGLRIVEVSVQMRQRLIGHSSIRYLATLYYMIKVTFAILLDMLKRNKTSMDKIR